ncbi:DNA-directed RNA polymerase subunit beta [Bacillus sp. B15-48]|uniref:DNA-directed RNA polymerase subunit beta n=1 Tax=Bacillus sp. B15-48 TaxID=1548601 RepID=UPI00193EEDF6|nr:DNA-directed RNA polymerase subunit beta [Bacillus sp. B15-48]MBM4761506.1 DNA-directed RNA polymerase subunit beta [Bacillus sp. B15-48]
MAVKDNHEEAVTREQVKKQKKEKKDKQEQDNRKRVRVRLFPIWLRVIVVIVFLALSIVAGAAFGYSVMGNGKPTEIFDKSTWTHIGDLINKN